MVLNVKNGSNREGPFPRKAAFVAAVERHGHG